MTIPVWFSFILACATGGLAVFALLGLHWRAQRAAADRRRERIGDAARSIMLARRELFGQPSIPAVVTLACRQLVDARIVDGVFIALHVFDELRVIAQAGRLTNLIGSAVGVCCDPSSFADAALDPCVAAFCDGKPRRGGAPAAISPSRDAPPWQHAAHSSGMRVQLVMPIRVQGTTVGVLSAYADRADGFDEVICEMIESFSIDMAFAIQQADRALNLRVAAKDADVRAEQIEQMFDACPSGIMIISSPQSRIVYVNQTICERHGMTREQMIGRTMNELGVGLLEPERQRALYAMLRDGHVRNMELMHLDGRGRVGPILLTLEPMLYFGEACTLVIGIDISQIRETQKRADDRLVAEAASQAKTAFLSRLGQELRTPLNAVMGFSQMLRDEAGDHLTAQDLSRIEHIRQASCHLMSLTNDILDMSSIEAGLMPVAVAVVTVAPELDFALTLSGPTAIAAGVGLHADYRDSAPVAVEADPLRLRQVMLNLLSNAIKYNRRGGEVWVRVDADGDTGEACDEVRIDVIDNGMGMTRDQLSRLFEPYNRLGRDQQIHQGLGIGLVVSRELIRLMGGRLDVDSVPDSGTRFRVMLKRRHPARKIDEAVVAPALGEARPTGQVLYVGDDSQCAAQLTRWLAGMRDVRFARASSDADALTVIAAQSPNLVLLDLPSTDVGGFELLRRIEHDLPPPAPRVVALSGSGAPQRIAQALRLGAVEYWTKPLEPGRVLASITAMLA